MKCRDCGNYILAELVCGLTDDPENPDTIADTCEAFRNPNQPTITGPSPQNNDFEGCGPEPAALS